MTRHACLIAWFLTLNFRPATAVRGGEAVEKLPVGARRFDTGKVGIKDRESSYYWAVALSPEGRTLATAALDDTIRLWNVATGQKQGQLIENGRTISQLDFSPDGKYLASRGWDGCVHLWDVARQKRVWRGKQKDESLLGLTFAPDSKTLLLGGSMEARLYTFDLSEGKIIRTSEPQRRASKTLVYLLDGKTLAAGCQDGTICFYDAASGKLTRQCPGHRLDIVSLAQSPDGKMLISGSLDGTIRYWEVASAQERRCINTGQGNVLAVALSPDGRLLASTGGFEPDAYRIRLWDTATGRLLQKLPGHRDHVRPVVFARQGKLLASGSYDHSAIVWDLARLPLPPAAPVVTLQPRQLEALWDDLASADAARAYRAIVQLAAAKEAPPYLTQRLRRRDARAKTIDRLIQELGSDSFTTRERAMKELAKEGKAVVPALRRALREAQSVEVRRRLQHLLEGPNEGELTLGELQQFRAIEALEQSGAKEARQALRSLAESENDVSQQAREALQRLARQKGD